MVLLFASCALMGISVSMFVYLLLLRGVSQMAIDTTDPMDYVKAPTAPVATPISHENGSSNLHEVLLARSRSERVVQPWLKKVNTILTGATPQSRIATLHGMAVTAGISRTWTP